MDLHIDKYGTFLSQKYERIVVKDNESKYEIPIKKINSVFLGSGGGVSNSALIKLIDNDIPILLLERDLVKGIFLKYPYSERPSILKSQINLSEEEKFEISKKIIIAKIKNQNQVLYLLRKSGQINYDLKYINEIINKIEKIDKNNWKNQLRGCESQFAKYYWENIRKVITDFPGREKRGANFHFNASLNYAYAILSSKIYNGILITGLDPSIPLFHSESDWKKALVYDVMECFRPNIDKAVISINTLKIFNPENDFDNKTHLLTPQGKKKIIMAVEGLLNSEKIYKGKKIQYSEIIKELCKDLKNTIVEKEKFIPYIWV